jgi:hypothetical protein
MATKTKKAKKKPAPEPSQDKLNPKDPNYFRLLGQRGGKANKKSHGRDADYFAKLASLSHQKRCENREARERERAASNAA